MDGARVQLPDGHLVNLSPRPARHSPYKAYRAEYKTLSTELCETALPGLPQEPRSAEYAVASAAPGNRFQKHKTTKLPVPSNLADNNNDRLNQTPSPTGLPKPTTPSHSGRLGDQPRSSDNGRDQYWKKIRNKFEKDSPSSPRSIKSKNSDHDQSPNPRVSYHRTRPAISSPQSQKSPRGANLRSAIPTPTSINSSPVQAAKSDASASRPVDSLNKWHKQGDQWINMDAAETTPQKSVRTDTTVNSSPRSMPSISPVSAEQSSITDWEDRFVVHMPTAKDPNPPTMTAQQIADYQKSIELVHRDGGQMADPNSLPSRNPSPESKLSLSEQRDQSLRGLDTYDGAYEGSQMPSSTRDEYRQPLPHSQSLYQPQQHAQSQALPQPAAAPQRQLANHYYSPDEIGHNRISTIWEESPSKIKEKRYPQNADGSFLGCREISGEKNPDEILKFASPDDASLHPRPLALTSKNKQRETKEVKKAPTRQTTHKPEQTVVLQEERPQTSQNTTPAQCSKQSTLRQDQNRVPNLAPIPRSESQDSGKENFHPTSDSPERPGSAGKGLGEDDVFIITPTITRTMIPTPDKKPSVPKPQGLRRPGGTSHTATAEAIKAVRAKAQMISTPLGLRPGVSSSNANPTAATLKTSQTFPLSKVPTTAKDQDDDQGQDADQAQDRTPERAAGATAHTVRGFIRTTGLAKSSGLVKSPTDSITTILRNGTESLRHRAESLRNASGSLQRANRKQSTSPQPTLPSRDNSESSRSERSFQSAKETSATESPPVLKKVSASEAVIMETKPVEIKPTEDKPSSPAPSAPIKRKGRRITLSEHPSSSHKPDKAPTSTKKISALAKPSKLGKTAKSTNEAGPEKPGPTKYTPEKPPPEKSTPEKSAPAKTGKSDAPSKVEERQKLLPRLRTTNEGLEIAELDGLQVASPKDESLQSNITDVFADLGDMHHRDRDEYEAQGLSTLALSLIFNILVVAVRQVSRIFKLGAESPYSKFVVSNTLNMTGHCWHVFGSIFAALSHYQATGAWPKARRENALGRFVVEFSQAIVYLIILGFAAMLVGRTASYVVLVSSWIVWFARPFAWVCQCVGRALIM